jgi:Fe-S-cluster-containing hydrogenase component 2
MINVDDVRCPQDHKCPMVKACPQHAISQEGHKAPKVDGDKCVLCMLCVNTCPYHVFESI